MARCGLPSAAIERANSGNGEQLMDLGECILTLTSNHKAAASRARGRAQAAPPAAGKSSSRKPGSAWIDLIPAGVFNGRDGRGPYRNEHPAAVIAATRKLGMTAGLPIDFDHAIDLGAPQGQPAPAAGWIKELRLVDGVIQGRVEWTAAGAKALAAKLYRYISPVFEFSGDGAVQRLLRAAVTNNPNLYLTAIAAAEAGPAAGTREHLRRAIHQIRASVAAPNPANLSAAHGCLSRVTSHVAARFLSAGDRELCRTQGVDAARFALAKRARMTGRPMVMTTRTDERAAELADERNMDASDWLKKAMAEIASFIQDPEHLDALQHLVNADAWVSQAIKLTGAVHTTAGVV